MAFICGVSFPLFVPCDRKLSHEEGFIDIVPIVSVILKYDSEFRNPWRTMGIKPLPKYPIGFLNSLNSVFLNQIFFKLAIRFDWHSDQLKFVLF